MDTKGSILTRCINTLERFASIEENKDCYPAIYRDAELCIKKYKELKAKEHIIATAYSLRHLILTKVTPDENGWITEKQWLKQNPVLNDWQMECKFGVSRFRPSVIYEQLKNI